MKKATDLWQRLKQSVDRLSARAASPRRLEPEEEIRESATDAGYYAEVSRRYSTAQLVLIILLAVFLVVSLLTDPDLLSSEHLLYMAKDMTVSLAQREGAARDTMVYAADAENRYDLYRDGLCVLGRQELTLFTATGRQAYTDRVQYATPRLDADGRYLLAYDLGGKNYRLYNSFACVESGVASAPIRGADGAKDGSYCLIMDGVDYASRVTWYDDRFRTIAHYNIEQYTLCADLTTDGKRLLLASVALDGGHMTTHISVAARGHADYAQTWTVEDAYPVAVAWTDKGNILLLSTDFVACYREDGRELSRYRFSTDAVQSFSLTPEGCVLVCRDNAYDTTARILAFDKEGEMVYNIKMEKSVTATCLGDGALAILSEGELWLYRQGARAAEIIPLTGTYTALYRYSASELLLCGVGQAVTVRASVDE